MIYLIDIDPLMNLNIRETLVINKSKFSSLILLYTCGFFPFHYYDDFDTVINLTQKQHFIEMLMK